MLKSDITTGELADLADNSRTTHADTTPLDIRTFVYEGMANVIAELERQYQALYLEARLVHERYHTYKNEAKDQGYTYGYIHTHVSIVQGSIQLRFFTRRPSAVSGAFDRSFIKRPKNGYTRRSFEGKAGHDYELGHCMEAEESFQRIRQESKLIRETIRKMKKLLPNGYLEAHKDGHAGSGE